MVREIKKKQPLNVNWGCFFTHFIANDFHANFVDKVVRWIKPHHALRIALRRYSSPEKQKPTAVISVGSILRFQVFCYPNSVLQLGQTNFLREKQAIIVPISPPVPNAINHRPVLFNHNAPVNGSKSTNEVLATKKMRAKPITKTTMPFSQACLIAFWLEKPIMPLYPHTKHKVSLLCRLYFLNSS